MSAYIPEYLPSSMHEKFGSMAQSLMCVGYSDADAPLLAKYLLAENEWQRITNHMTAALNRGDCDSASKWLTAQDKLVNQSLKLSEALNMSPRARLTHGVPYPGSKKKSGGVAHEQRNRLQISTQ